VARSCCVGAQVLTNPRDGSAREARVGYLFVGDLCVAGVVRWFALVKEFTCPRVFRMVAQRAGTLPVWVASASRCACDSARLVWGVASDVAARKAR